MNSPRTPMEGEPFKAARTNRCTAGLTWSAPRTEPLSDAWAPTPTTLTGMVTLSSRSLMALSESRKLVRNALARGMTRWS